MLIVYIRKIMSAHLERIEMNITREQVIKWALEADMDIVESAWGPLITAEPADLEKFAALIAAAAIKFAPDYKMGYADGVAAQQEAFNKERQQYADWFDEAAADIYDWGGYASEYFQEKYDLEANVQDFRNRAAAIRARNNQ